MRQHCVCSFGGWNKRNVEFCVVNGLPLVRSSARRLEQRTYTRRMLIALSISQLIHDPFFVRRFSTEKGMSTRVQEETVSGYSAGHNIWVIECNHVETSNSSSVLNFKPQLVEIYTTIVVEYEYISRWLTIRNERKKKKWAWNSWVRF